MQNKKRLIGIIVSLSLMLLVVGSGVAALVLLNRPQIAPKAAVVNGPVKIDIAPITMALQPGGSNAAKVMIHTSQRKISGIATELTFTYQGTPPINMSQVTVSPAFLAASGFTCLINKVVPTATTVSLQVACTLTTAGQGYSNNAAVEFYSVPITAGNAPTAQPVVITFNPEGTVVTDFDTTEDIVAIPQHSLAVTVGGTVPPASPSPVPSPSPSPTTSSSPLPSPSPSPSVSPSPSPTVSPSPSPSVSPSPSPTTSPQPTTSPTAAPSTKRVDVTYTLKCDPQAVDLQALVREANQPLSGVKVVFAFNGQTKESATNSEGRAAVVFPYGSAGTYTATATPDGWSTQSTTVTATLCSATTGAGTVMCSGACTATRDCSSGLSCLAGRCRNDRCSTDTTCACNTTSPAQQTGTSDLPSSGSVDTTVFLLLMGLLFIAGGAHMIWAYRIKSGSDIEQFSD